MNHKANRKKQRRHQRRLERVRFVLTEVCLVEGKRYIKGKDGW